MASVIANGQSVKPKWDTPLFKGLYAATLTPFKPDGTLDVDGYLEYAKHLLSFKDSEGNYMLAGVYANGTTGESMSMSTEERKLATEAWMKAFKELEPDAAKRPKVITHIGSDSLPDCQVLAAHAEQIGADGIAVMPPHFFRPTNEKPIVDFLSKIASHAPNTPFLYYEFPVITGVTVPAYRVIKLAVEKIPTFQGAKMTTQDVGDIARSTLRFPHLSILSGYEETFLAHLLASGTGSIGMCFSLTPAPFYRMLRTMGIYPSNHPKTGTPFVAPTLTPELLAGLRKDLSQILKLLDLIGEVGSFKGRHGLSVTKVLMRERYGLEFGEPRSPLTAVSEDAELRIVKGMRARLDTLLV
ncbi:aldolase [Gonapodya prolifera JEL478]|uniref:N-acetylneuraminate lyase n=1 Tax=Gonapodya prolifera (strain JEL478) TaxID=1344416 RepID=A0A139A5Y7_GONPJ|nr:aldolase [Gonapodya prolifera JEL478]|eukprot:KXS12230.1 aldolase [Gonapodya prolifera JEL478]